MELVLTKNTQNQVFVTCDNQPSHTFSLTDLLSQHQDDQLVLTNSIPYGHDVQTGARQFAALFADPQLGLCRLDQAPQAHPAPDRRLRSSASIAEILILER